MAAGRGRGFYAIVAVVAGFWPMALQAATACVSSEEAEAFRLRHLQTRLMVAGLSCGQQDAYNAFVSRLQPMLSGYGPRLIGYFKRAGGGQAALNRYITELANAAAVIRSANPATFCAQTWDAFWTLQQEPEQLTVIAAANPIPSIRDPEPCAVPDQQSAASPEKQTAAPMTDAAAQ